ncbi:MAG: nucleoside triphosphate pyrophosphohydrolase [Prochlorothrix sp.]|nr:nucleoside triphosphate pyrophosphohydrolase [Prochlorothrix sp.]
MSSLPQSADLPPIAPEVLEAVETLVAVVAQLRSPDGGCPWDLAQTPQSLIPYVLEEAYEVADALRRDDREAVVEELGDLLLQVVLQAQVAQDSGQFTLKEVAQGIGEKLVRRHPHVFGEVTVADTEEVRRNWEQIKAQEKGENPEEDRLSPKLRRYAQTLPPLTAAAKISRRAVGVGFEWDCVADVWAKLEEELQEFREAIAEGDPVHQEEELGDVLFVLVQLARWHQLDCAEALHGTNAKFVDRFEVVERLARQQDDRPLEQLDLVELDRLWNQAKALLRQSPS